MTTQKRGTSRLAVANFILFGIIPFISIVFMACGSESKAVSSEWSQNVMNLPIDSNEVIFAQNSNGNGEPFACEFKITYNSRVFKFTSVNSGYTGKEFVGNCALLKKGELSKFKITESTRGTEIISTEIYWCIVGEFKCLQGFVVTEAPMPATKS